MQIMNLNDSVSCIKGVGEKKAAILNKLNIYNVEELLYHFPRRYEDRRVPKKIIEAIPGNDAFLEVVVVSINSNIKRYGRNSLVKVLCKDDTGQVELLFFNAKYVMNYFKIGDTVTVYGRITENNGRKQISHPEYRKKDSKDDIRGLYPIYPLTQGLTQASIRSIIREARPYISLIKEWLPMDLVEKNKLCSPSYAIENIHFPVSERPILEGRYRLIFEELLTLQTGLFYIKSDIKKEEQGVKFDNIDTSPFLNSLSFKLTDGQLRAIEEITKDLISEKSMNRLVQGDVGSGKTIVAEIAMYQAFKSGFQAVMMAPTEILAKQHFASLKRDFEPFGAEVAMLLGSQTKKEKSEILDKLKCGEIDILVGTHAIIQPNVEFFNLGLVITDEQHRFGVNQRTLLEGKGKNPNVLVMTATPIPRTLAVILYGDLDVSIIDTLPKGRLPIKTYQRGEDSRDKIYDFVESEIKKGRQAYVVCPLIEESESIDCKSADEIYTELSLKYPKLNFGLMHGELKNEEKDAIFERFIKKEIDVLVSTVVIEVGVDVPNASIIVIENSERFGLAQLHQLRGRVGRSNNQSYCILISGHESTVSKKRNDVMCQTTSGFVIAEEDLKLRGPGEIFGTRQHGLPELHISDLIKNIDILEKVKDISLEILSIDPNLSSNKYLELRRRIVKLFGENITLKL